jgi:hypothetical protein
MKSATLLFKYFVFFITISCASFVTADNQTPTVSPIFPETSLPFRVQIKLADFALPDGIQSYVLGTYEGKWLILDGRTNGLHGFNDDPNNFPPQKQNTTVYVIDPVRKTVASRSLNDPGSGLTQDQIDSLSVTSPQSYQSGNTLYITGGYGFRHAIDNFITFDVLTAVDIPGLIKWVLHPSSKRTVAQSIRQISNPIFQVTGGFMTQIGCHHPVLLVFGQTFEGTYGFGESIQIYSRQVRRFQILDNGRDLEVIAESSLPFFRDPNFRRRDLNVVPVIQWENHRSTQGLVAFSGVFTPSFGVWTVPVTITADGEPSMADPADPLTFKQGMNNYVCPTVGLFSRKSKEMFTVFCGGISYGFFENGIFQTDSNIPFINQVTTVKLDPHGRFTQYLMNAQYPVILSTQSNPGNPLLFGAGAQFIVASDKIPQYSNGVIQLDRLEKPTLVGYIVGGIASTLPNTNTASDSEASPYIFKVIVEPVSSCD